MGHFHIINGRVKRAIWAIYYRYKDFVIVLQNPCNDTLEPLFSRKNSLIRVVYVNVGLVYVLLYIFY